MNDNERIAYKYLLKRYDLKDIEFNGRNVADFHIKSTNEKYECKKLYGDTLTFSERQLTHLSPDDMIIVVGLNKVLECFKWGQRFKTNYAIMANIPPSKSETIRIRKVFLDILRKINPDVNIALAQVLHATDMSRFITKQEAESLIQKAVIKEMSKSIADAFDSLKKG